MANKKSTTPKEIITAATINRVVSKETGKCLGYLVKSNSSENYYQITWSRERKAYQCNCAATVKCCHIKALEQVLTAKKEITRASHLSDFFAALATYAQQQVAEQAVAEAEQAVQPPQRYCESCSCALPLEMVDGLMLCQTCADNTRPAISEPPPTKPLAVAKTKAPPSIVNRGNAQLGNNKSFSLMR